MAQHTSDHTCIFQRTFLFKSRPSCNSAPMWAPTALSFSGAKNLLIDMGWRLLFASLVPRMIMIPAVKRHNEELQFPSLGPPINMPPTLEYQLNPPRREQHTLGTHAHASTIERVNVEEVIQTTVHHVVGDKCPADNVGLLRGSIVAILVFLPVVDLV